jgi:hypothetical protein
MSSFRERVEERAPTVEPFTALVRGIGSPVSRLAHDDRPERSPAAGENGFHGGRIWWNHSVTNDPERVLMADLPPIPPMPKFMTVFITSTIAVVLAVVVLIIVINAVA